MTSFQRIRVKGLLLTLSGLLLTACNEPEPVLQTDNPASARWYSDAQVTAGAAVFAEHCAVCHGSSAEGTASDWRQRLDDGAFPPPPLNGSAHAWHHSNAVLLQVIENGGAAFGGKMPAFAEVLDQTEKLAVIAYFQNYWSDEIYAQWMQMGGPD